jgi:hypothetical protein
MFLVLASSWLHARCSDGKGGGLLVSGVDAFGIWHRRQMQAPPLFSDASTTNIRWWDA